MRFVLPGLALLLAGAAAALAADAPVEVVHPWARASLAGSINGAAYMTLISHEGADDRLVSVTTPVAESAEIHVSRMKDGVMTMRPLGWVDLKPGVRTVLEPNGVHVMLLHLQRRLKAGDSFPMTLHFEKGGSEEIAVAVEAADYHVGHMEHHHQ
jgi:periplasmic copper chaperone A